MRNQRGVALSVVVIVLFVLIGMVGLAVDVGRIAYTAAEAQAAADAGAAAGGWALLKAQLGGGSADDVTDDASAVLLGNQVNGGSATMAPGSPELGTYSSGVFTPGAAFADADAVRVTVTTDPPLNNIVMGIFGSAQSTVTKQGIAAILNLGAGSPTLPLAVGECKFTPPPAPTPTPSVITFRQAPSFTDSSAFTTFLDGATSTNAIKQYLPSACDGDDATIPTMTVGDPTTGSTNVTNGQTSVLRSIECMFCSNMKEFVVPVIQCGDFTGAEPVLGFATIVVDSFVYNRKDRTDAICSITNLACTKEGDCPRVPEDPGGPNVDQHCGELVSEEPCCGSCPPDEKNKQGQLKGINAHVIEGSGSGPGGGGAFGTRTVRLVG